MTFKQDIHIGQTVLAGSHILDLNQKLHTVPDCRGPCARCLQRPYPSAWVHPACYDILRNNYEPATMPTLEDLKRLADATKPLYNCQHKEHRETESVTEGLFSNHTREIIQDSFRQDLLAQLPVEIITMISELLTPCWYLTVLGEARRLIEHLRDKGGTQSKQLSLAPEMWMSRITYRGTSYVTQLSGKPLESTGPSEQRHIKLPDNISTIILSVDCIGTRGIQFVDQKSDPTYDGSPWYEVMDVRDDDLEVGVSYDGLYMRGIQLTSSNPSTYRAWSSPFPPLFHPWNFYQVRPKSRLDYIKFDSHTRGILVCCANSMAVGIHGFSDVSKTFREFIDLMNRRMGNSYKHWIYFPLNTHEHIKAAWIRKLRMCRGPASNPVLVLATSLGRTITFGPQFPARILDQYEYHPLVRDGDGAISGIFHDGLNPAVKYTSEFGVTCNGQRHVEPSEPPPMDTPISEPPAVPPGRGSIASTWYMTQAPLKDLVKVRVCRDREQPHRPCLGFLLFYSDGHIESIGQVRWDYDLNQECSRPLYVENGVVSGRDYIKDIRSDIDETEIHGEESRWQRLPEHGIIKRTRQHRILRINIMRCARPREPAGNPILSTWPYSLHRLDGSSDELSL
ncbi:hypothetical protein P170DRAFT_469873 [Aspergillus steynii IBT 23096]|uniref:Uncharacterized protein n=1 Tax=Aspergillus steynii IBT 23096 TaxID=1392250 RepID=A0A2I2GNF3_9EURO|nr:uncharacterized protein P170DRAFT_469873 [Aspergillus steynii IBT 23096]PLB54407.1 hypothetical protein P170DRAFT_469873 [Aspergillus steynii IBT 23096]